MSVRAVADRGLAAQPRLAAADQCHVGGRPAYVEREQVGEAGLQSDPERAGDSARRAGHQQIHGSSSDEAAEARPPSERRMWSLTDSVVCSSFSLRLCT